MEYRSIPPRIARIAACAAAAVALSACLACAGAPARAEGHSGRNAAITASDLSAIPDGYDAAASEETYLIAVPGI